MADPFFDSGPNPRAGAQAAPVDPFFGTPVGSKAKPQPIPIANKGGNPVLDFIKHAEQKGVAGLEWASETPVAKGADAVLNATSRLGLGTLAGGVGEGVHSFLTPSTITDETHAVERKFGLPVVDDPKKAGFWRNALQAGEDFGVQTFGDVGTYVPGLDVFSVGKRALGLGRALGDLARGIEPIDRAARAVGESAPVRGIANAVDKVKSGVVEFHDIRSKDSGNRETEDIIKEEEKARFNEGQHREQAAIDLMDAPAKNAPAQGATNREMLLRYQDQRARLQAQARDLKQIEGWNMPGSMANNAYEEVARNLELTKLLYPPDIREALLQRAYREGTPEIRAKAVAAGYKPSAEEAASRPLNILHHWNEEYEPTQMVVSEEDKAKLDELRQGPVHYIKQNRRAKFDLPKKGGTPETPLDERILDRLVTGSRIEAEKRKNLNILHRLGFASDVTRADVESTQRLLHQAEARVAAGDLAAKPLVEQYTRQQSEQIAALNAAEELRNKHSEKAKEWVDQHVELTDPITARQRVIKESVASGNPLTKYVTVGKGKGNRKKQIALLDPRDTQNIDTKEMRGKLKGLRSALVNMEQVTKGARNAQKRVGQQFAEGQVAHARALDRAFLARQKEGVATIQRAQQAQAQRMQQLAEKNRVAAAHYMPGGVKRGAVKQFDPAALGIGSPRLFGGKDAFVGGQKFGTKATARLRGFVDRTQQAGTQSLGDFGRILEQQRAFAKQYAEKSAAAQAQRAERFEGGEAKTLRGHVLATDLRKDKAILRYEQQQLRIQQAKRDAANRRTMLLHAKDIDTMVNTVPIPKHIHARLYGQIPKYNRTLAATFSDLQREALFVIPLAHMKNISLLALLGPGGPRTVAAGMKYAHDLRVKPDDPTLAARTRTLENMGATEHYISEAESPFAGMGKAGEVATNVLDFSNRALERYDLGMRMALEDELRRKNPTATDTWIGGQIRDVLGDYKNQAPLIKQLRDWAGANFPAWGLGVVPRAMTKALREHPRAFKAYARANQVVSNDVTEPTWGTDLDVGGPPEDFFSLLERPDKFLKSPSRSGIAGLVAGGGDAVGYGEPLEFLAQEGARAIPFSAPIETALGWPYADSAPAAVRAGLGLFGAYNKNAASRQQRENQLHKLGMKEPQLSEQLRYEGYDRRPPVQPLPVQPPPGALRF